MLSSLFLAGLVTGPALAAPYAVFNKLPVGKAMDTSETATITSSSSRTHEHNSRVILESPATVLVRRGRGRYQTKYNDKTANCTKAIGRLSARIPIVEAEAEAGRGIYQTIKIDTVGDGEKSRA